MAREALESLRGLDQLLDLRVALHFRCQARLGLERLVDRGIELVRDQLRDPVDLAVGDVERPPHVPDHALGGHGAEGDDLTDVVPPVLVGDVADHLRPAVHAEVHVDVGRGDALGVEEALEEQVVLQRVDVGDPEAVRGQAPDHGAAPRADGDATVARVLDQVPDDEEVARELHRLDHLDLERQALLVGNQRLLERLRARHRLELRAPAFEPFARHLLEVGVRGEAGGNGEIRHLQLARLQAHVAALGHPQRVEHRLGHLAPDLPHLLERLEVELIRGVAHPVGLLHRPSGTDAEQDVVRGRVLAPEVVGVVGADERDAGLLRDVDQSRVDAPLLLEPLVLQLEEKVALAEDVAQDGGLLQGRVEAVLEQPLGHGALEAGRERDQPLRVPGEQLLVHPGLVVEPLEIGERHELREVLVTGEVRGQEDEVVGLIAAAGLLVPALLGHVDLAADDRGDPALAGRVVKLDRAEEVAVVGHGQRGHPQARRSLGELVYLGGAVEQAEVGVIVEMDEGLRFSQGATPTLWYPEAWR